MQRIESMAVDAHSARLAAFTTEYTRYIALKQQLEQSQPEDRDSLERAIAEQEEDLLDTPAGALTQVQTKLEILLGDLFGLDPETEYRRLVLEDLAYIIDETRGLIGERA
jgi:hypothetical protein